MDTRSRKVSGQGSSSDLVLVMRGCREGSARRSKLLCVPLPFVAFCFTCARRVKDVVELRVRDVKLIWIDPNDGAVSVVQFLNVEDVLAAKDDVIVEFIPASVISDGSYTSPCAET